MVEEVEGVLVIMEDIKETVEIKDHTIIKHMVVNNGVVDHSGNNRPINRTIHI